jgi:hypothetical protein
VRLMVSWNDASAASADADVSGTAVADGGTLRAVESARGASRRGESEVSAAAAPSSLKMFSNCAWISG